MRNSIFFPTFIYIFNVLNITLYISNHVEIMPFWILDFRFWIENQRPYLGCRHPSVAFFFPIGITPSIMTTTYALTQKTKHGSLQKYLS
jgi:hypothetical protein